MNPTLSPEEVEAQLRAYGRNHASATVEQALEWAAADTIADLRRQLAEARARADTHWQRWKPGDPRCEGCDKRPGKDMGLLPLVQSADLDGS